MPSWQSNASRDTLIVSLFALFFFVASVWLSWTGFIGSDDALYADAALKWLQQGPLLGTTHFSLRLTTVIPDFLSFKIFGVREFSLILPSLVCGVTIATLLAFLAVRILGTKFALLAILPFVTAPLFSSMASTPGIDLVELLFDVASLCLFLLALERKSRSGLLFLCGLLAGLGWMSRETSVFLVFYYGVLFLAGFRIERREYLLIAAGFLAVALGEMLTYFLLTGDLFYRLKISLHHDLVDRSAIHGLFDREGNLHLNGPVGTILNPFLMIFFNKIFGIMFWVTIPAAVWLFRSPRIPNELRAALLAVTIAGAIWLFGVFALVGKLYLVPRYILFPLFCASLLVGAWLSQELLPRSKRLAVGLVGAIVLVNVVAINLEDHDYMFPERALVAFIRSTTAMVYTDHETLRRAAFLLECEDVNARVSDEPHGPGDLFFYVPANSAFKERYTGQTPTWQAPSSQYLPLAGEYVVARFVRPERWPARLIEAAGLSSLVPQPLMAKLRGDQGSAFVYSTHALNGSR